MMTNVSIPAGARWIPKGMTVEYLAKAKTDLTAVASGEGVDWSSEGDKVVPVVVTDTEGKTVFTAQITMNVKLGRSEEHTSELQSRPHLVCRLLLEKKKREKMRSYGRS